MLELQLMVATGVAAMLLVASIGKLRSPNRFRAAVAGYGLLPAVLVAPVSWFVPILEFGLGVGLLTGWAQASILRAAAGLFIVLAIAMAATLARGLRPSCGCALGHDRQVGWPLIVRNITAAVAAVAASVSTTSIGLQSVLLPSSPLRQADAVAGVLTLLLVGLTYRVTSEGVRVCARTRTFARGPR